ncbi:MAG: hypothetical protein JWN86_930 [Planctomycetota bacterium]|nr:hypothetical protein [Planctomycetota bacterium]
MNSIMVIHPYKTGGVWAFDDPEAGLVREPFVSGADTVIERLVESLPGAEGGFTLFFSAQPFPGYQAEFAWRRQEMGGNWYFSPAHQIEGWLCPALFKYFPTAPERLYVQVKPRTA